MRTDKYIKNYINGELVSPLSQEYVDNVNPSTGQVYSYIPRSGKEDVQRAVESAEAALKEWSTCGVKKRFRILNRVADIIEQNQEDFAAAETFDTGRPIKQAEEFDIEQAHNIIRFYATSIIHFQSQSHYVEEESISYTLRQPIGVVGCIAPWNQPLYLFTKKIAPALAVGNTVVAKPSEVTPLTTYLFSKACIEGGLPPGVLNIVHGNGTLTGDAIAKHPKVRAISFTGSIRSGKKLAQTIAPLFKKSILEVGGKNPNIIFDDCDFEPMIATTLKSSFSNQGQLHLCCPRIFVHRSVYRKFREEFVKRTQYLKIGDPFATVTDIGSIVSEKHMKNVLKLIEDAKKAGGAILCGGEQIKLDKKLKKGFFIKPTVIEGLNNVFRINESEIYGPVVTIVPFDTEEEVIKLANQTDYGFAASIWTNNIARANRVAAKLQVGVIWINDWGNNDLRSPTGGVKRSGVGVDGGLETLKFFTEPKNITVNFKH